MTQKITFFLVIGVFIMGIRAPFVYAEEIKKFDTTLTIQENGMLRVSENILYDFGPEYRHGIFRTIPLIKTNTEGKKYILGLSDFRVTGDSGIAYNFTASASDLTETIKIGDADRTISGVHPYNINYTVSGAMTYFSDHDELYWNSTGNEWKYPIEESSVSITLPKQVTSTEVTLTCFTGTRGSTNQDCTSLYENGTAAIRITKPLAASEGLTVVIGFPKGIVATLEPAIYVPFWETFGGKILLGILLLLSIGWYIILPISIPIKWWKHGRDPKPVIGETSAWFSPPKTKNGRNVTPGETGTLVDEKAQMHDITSTLIHLAQRGYLRILEPKKGDFHLERTADSVKNDSLQHFEQTLLGGIFTTGDLISLKTTSLVSTVEKTKKELYKAVISEDFFETNPESIRTKYIILAVLGFISGNFPLLLSSLLFGIHMPKKTVLGSQQAAIARSLKNFLTSQERQLAFQAKNQMMFEKLLPYAIAFGVEKIWAKRFSDISMKQPDWYQGYSHNRFNSILFVNSLSHTNSSFAGAATPVSSSTGHSSGFSGGSSGGGGGGGGGGSW